MKTIRLHEALISPGYSKTISFPLDLSDQALLIERGILDAKGEATMCIRNSADIVTVRFFGEIKYKTECDRCLTPMAQVLVFDYTKDVKKICDDEDFDGIILSADESFDYEQEVVTEVLLSFPAKHLCVDDCKGLCPVCGCNLNERECSCDKRVPDPRLEVLRNLKW